jgi:hypothetical protein
MPAHWPYIVCDCAAAEPKRAKAQATESFMAAKKQWQKGRSTRRECTTNKLKRREEKLKPMPGVENKRHHETREPREIYKNWTTNVQGSMGRFYKNISPVYTSPGHGHEVLKRK